MADHDRGDDTVAQSPTALARPRAAVERIGRYQIDHLLGEGGMGSVYLALDTDLQRHVALKLLRGSDHPDARARLLREARAMARLHHPNVVMVHEVGRADDRDFVAMELVEGNTLANWLCVETRSPREIIDAFVAAGRGLAAAHAAGIVHRDFKPHNVLRSEDGRVLVTDFGLARGIERVAEPEPVAGRSTPQPLASVTAAGHYIGTPAYMAPEQWDAGEIGPAADQFAFCVALWEALAGERPFRAPSDDELRVRVKRGPAELDASKIPRALRAALLRGLAAKPEDRWPSMDALIARLRRAQRRPLLIASAAAAILALGAVPAFLVAHAREPAGEPLPLVTCTAPARTAEAVVADARTHLAGKANLVATVECEAARWHALRTLACVAPDRAPRLACFDRALERLDLVTRAASDAKTTVPADALYDLLVDPLACLAGAPPRIVPATSNDVRAAAAVLLEHAKDRIGALATSQDACARAIVLPLGIGSDSDEATARRMMGDAEQAADRCGDDRISAMVALAALDHELDHWDTSAGADAALARADAILGRIAQPDLVAERDVLAGLTELKRGNIAHALARFDGAITAFAARGRARARLDAIMFRFKALFTRGRAEDLATIRSELARERAAIAAIDDPALTDGSDTYEAYALLFTGDVAGSHAVWTQVWQRQVARSHATAIRREGIVVDPAGAPVGGATIYLGATFITDPIGPLPVEDPPFLRTAISDARGHFAIDDVVPGGGVAYAVRDTQRSPRVRAGDKLRLVLEPTRRISGHVRLGDVPATRAVAVALLPGPPPLAIELAPIASDGTFTLPAVSTGPVVAGVMVGLADNISRGVTQAPVPAGTADITDLAIVAPISRTLYVIVRSTLSAPLEAANVGLYAGHRTDVRHAADRLQQTPVYVVDAFPPDLGDLPASVARELHPGDLLARVGRLPAGELDACATPRPTKYTRGLPGDFLVAHAAELEMRCTPVPASGDTIVIETPPQKRFE